MWRIMWFGAGLVLFTWSSAWAEGLPDLASPLQPPEEHYRLDVRYIPEAGRIEGSGTIRLKNTTRQALSRLRLAWDGKQPGDLEVTLGGQPALLRGAAPESWGVELSSPLEAEREIEVGLRFQRAVKKLEPGEALPLADWHPRLFWGYETHASFDVKIDAPAGVLVASSGRLNPATGRSVAAGIRSFGLWFGRGYEVVESSAGDTLVRVYFLPAMRQGAETLATNAADAIQFYRKRFGRYPQPSLSIVPGEPAPVEGGYPFATAMVMIHSMGSFGDFPEAHWRWIVAHEVGHQYWLEHVMAKDPETKFGWLMIGLGIWTDREFSRHRGITDLHPVRLHQYANTVRNGMNTTIEMSPEQIRRLNYDYNSQVTHNKGFGILSALAAILGQETFDRVHSRCLREYAGRRMGTAEFRRVAEEESGQDLGWFFIPWVRTNGYPSYEIAAVEKSEEAGWQVARVRVRWAGTIALPVPVEARFEDGSRTRLWTDRLLAEQTLEFRHRTPLKEAVLDPDREFPLVIPPPQPEYQELVSKVLGMPWTGAGDQAVALYEQARKLNVKDGDVLLKLWMLLYDGRHYEKALDACRDAAALYKGTDKVRYFIALYWEGILLDLQGRREEALERYREALPLAGDVKIQHSQYELVIDRAWVEQRLKEPFVRK